MAEQKITLEFNHYIAEFIAFAAADQGFENSKEFIEAYFMEVIYEILSKMYPTTFYH